MYNNPPLQGVAMQPTIRLATESDLVAINDIYNHYVLNATCTYQEEPETMAARVAWFARHGERHPVTVAVAGDEVVGWGSLTPLHGRSAYRFTVENSVYIHHAFHRQRIGSSILADLILRAKRIGHHCIIASIDGEQTVSLALHAKFGFEKVAHLKEVGFKFGRWLDVIYLEKML
jgi:phosphinothricin acetyltransferase